jgi:hypothetical protein
MVTENVFGFPIAAQRTAIRHVDLGDVSARRDGWGVSPGPGDDPAVWPDESSQLWVDAARRISPDVAQPAGL